MDTLYWGKQNTYMYIVLIIMKTVVYKVKHFEFLFQKVNKELRIIS